MYIVHRPQIWEFYSHDKDGKETNVETKECRYPTKTKVYKGLKKKFERGEIHGYGLRVKEKTIQN